MRRITIKDERWEKNEHHKLEAYVNDTGDLVLAGYDAGDSVKEHYDDFDHEYWHTVKAEYVPAVLLWLIKEKFESAHAFVKWLEEKEIAHDSMSF